MLVVTITRPVRRDSSIESVEGHNLDCSKSQGNILSNARRRVTCIKAQRPVLVRLSVENRVGAGAGEIGLVQKNMYGTRDAANN